MVNCSSGFASNIVGPTLQQRFVAAKETFEFASHCVQDHSAPVQEAGDDGTGERSANVVDEPDRRSSHGQCCGMLCVNALAAEVAELINPLTLTSRRELAAYRRTADNDPAALYRPPNF